MIVSDSSTIIALGKQGMLRLLKECFGKTVVAEAVYKEVMGKKDSPEAAAADNAIKEKWLVRESIQVNLMLATQNIGKGEKEAISLTAKHGTIILTDDEVAKSYATLLEVESHGTLYVVLIACKKKLITKEKASEAVNGMISQGLYISTEVYSRFMEMIGSL